MKTVYGLTVMMLVLFSAAFTCADSSGKKNVAGNNANNGFAVVELFTSEGCSSCPPADNAVAKLLKEYSNNVYVLGLHVDYWDNLGWKDAFSSAAFTKRQGDYARIFKLGSVYTPQVVINGEEQFVGSDEKRLNASVEKDLQQTSLQTLSLTAKSNNNTINVAYKTSSINNNLNIALIQLSAESKVQRGENHGATLHHVNIVRDLQTMYLKNSSGSISLNLPKGLTAKDCEVIAFIQDANMKITSASKTDIQL